MQVTRIAGCQDAKAGEEALSRRSRREASGEAPRAAAALRPDALVTVAPPGGRIIVTPVARPACPWLIVHGDRDELVDAALVRKWAGDFAPPPRLVVLADAEHFFNGRLGELRAAVLEFLAGERGGGVRGGTRA